MKNKRYELTVKLRDIERPIVWSTFAEDETLAKEKAKKDIITEFDNMTDKDVEILEVKLAPEL